MKGVLLVAAFYNILWGIVTIFWPELFFNFSGMDLPRYPELWQCIGMIVGVYGVGYFIAAFNPYRHWPIVLVGLMGKIFGPIGFVNAFLDGSFTLAAGYNILFNDLIWWIPFILILRGAYYYHNDLMLEKIDNDHLEFEKSLRKFKLSDGLSLFEQSQISPTLIVFLRHFGCTFCREALQDLAQVKDEIYESGKEIVVVHMIDPDQAQYILDEFNLGELAHISDPEKELYAAFKLERGNFFQLFGFKVWWRGFLAGVMGGLGVGRMQGDGFQMPGAFLLHKTNILHSYRHRSAADRPDYVYLANCEIPQVEAVNP